MPDYSGRVIESQVDWLTVSAHGEDAARNLLDLALGLAKGEEALGAKPRPLRLMGYEGYHVGRTEYGQRDKGSTILRLIGQLAADRTDVALSLADSVTRLDLAVTWQASPPDPHIGPNAYTLAVQHWEKNQRRALPWHVQDPHGGYTCYVGKRGSIQMLRIYNKEAEAVALGDDEQARRYAGCWRFELETHDSMAHTLSGVIEDAENRSDYVQSYLHTYCEQHGIVPPFPKAARQPYSLASVAAPTRTPSSATWQRTWPRR